jgi:serine/threonine protein kinase
MYDSAQTVTVAVSVNGVTPDSSPTTLVVRNVITSCDAAFAVPGGSEDNTVYVVVEVLEGEEDLNLGLAIGLLIAFALVIGLAVFLFYEHKRKENESVWKVKKEELQFSDPPKIIGRGTFGLVLMAEYRGTQVAVKHVIPPRGKEERDPMASGTNTSVSETSNTNNGATTLSGSGSYNVGMKSGSSCVGKVSGSNKSDTAKWRKLRHEFIGEMRHLSKLRHPCVTTVMGKTPLIASLFRIASFVISPRSCFRPPGFTGAVIGNNVEPMLVMEYMDHGSLYDLLHNETMVIEGELLLPILRDVSQGVRFLHSATPQVLHGDLKAQNILVDSKFRAKVADFGLSQKKNVGGTGTPFWMAPELLRGESKNTAASDVYSFGVILYEVYSRKDPYEGEDPVEVLRLVADQIVHKRPPIPTDCPSQVQSLMTDCLNDDPNKRPTFEELDTRLKRADVATVHPGQISTKKISFSLFDIFPKHIAEALQAGRTVEPEHRDVVTIFFSDIVGFTNISSKLPPRKVAEMLDRLYTKFDALSRKHDVFKVETIGDSYMAVTNLVKDQPLDHVKRMTEFAIDTVKAANDTYIDPDDQGKGFVNVRIGFHCGSVVADVVGTMNPRYCLFGDSVNTASRMESSSEVNRIHCSSAAAEILMGQQPSLPLKSRGLIHIKGKGDMHTYWVNEHEDGATNETDEISFTENTILDWAKGKPPSQGLKMEPVKEEAHPDAQSDEFQVEETEAHQDAHSDDFQEEETNESLHDDLEAQESSH